MISKILFLAVLIIFSIDISGCCNTPKECHVIDLYSHPYLGESRKALKCLLKDDKSQLRLQISTLNKSFIDDDCEIQDLIIRPNKERSLRFRKGIIDIRNLVDYSRNPRYERLFIDFQFFNGFELNLFDESLNFRQWEDYFSSVELTYCVLDFYDGEKQLKSCDDFKKSTTNDPRSIIQLVSNTFRSSLSLILSESKNKLCPLVFKNNSLLTLRINGENSFYSRRLLSFSNDSFDDLESSIRKVFIHVDNIELDFSLLHPSVFKEIISIELTSKVNSIHPELFPTFKKLRRVFLRLEYMRSLMHKNGIDWVRNINRDVKCDLSNSTEISEKSYMLSTIIHDVGNQVISELFPEQDFCLYMDFPIDQLVVILGKFDENRHKGIKLGCTYLWLTRSYKYLSEELYNYRYFEVISLILSALNNTISECDFEAKLNRCNRSNFHFEPRHLTTLIDVKQVIYTIEIVSNLLTFPMAIFGIVTNSLIIIAISSKINKSDFKGFKQYDYLRLYSIFNLSILVVYMSYWLNECVYPYQVFCPLIRKSLFMQYFKIIVQNVFLSALRFMNNFAYVGFAFNRMALIGKDHHQLVCFMRDLGIKTYIGVSAIVCVSLSVVKFFEYGVNTGQVLASYPISSYDYESLYVSRQIFFLFNFISDVLNHVVFLLVNFIIDVTMVLRLRRTLSERLESLKAYSTIAQQEKKRSENESVVDNALSMVIANTTLNLLLKTPFAVYSFIYLFNSAFRMDKFIGGENGMIDGFFNRVCVDAGLCRMILKVADLLYVICISVQFFFYRHYDKKLNAAVKKRFGSEKSIYSGLLAFFHLVNSVNSTSNNSNDAKVVINN